MHKLIIEDDEGKAVVVPLIRDEISIGRQEGNTIRLTERNVSRRHARLVRREGRYVLEDLGSHTGTKINGAPAKGPVPLSDGDHVVIGDYKLAIKIERPTTTTLGYPNAAVPAMVSAVAVTPVAMHATAAAPAAAIAPAEPMEGAPTIPVRTLADQGLVPATGDGPAVATAPARLVVMTAPLAGQEFLLDRASVVIGRTQENDIVLNHKSISRHHAKVIRDGDRYVVVDLESANGVRVNGAEYERVELQSGDVLELGHVRLRFATSDDVGGFDTDYRLGPNRKPLFIGVGAAAVLIIGGVLLFGGKKEAPPPPAPKTVVAKAPEPAPPKKVPLEESAPLLLDQAKKAYQNRKWDEALALVEKAVNVSLDDVPEAADLRKAIEAERQNAATFDTIQHSMDTAAYEAVLTAYPQISEGSVYKEKAKALDEEARGKLIARHLAAAEKKRIDGDCGEVRKEANAVLVIDKENQAAQDLVARCGKNKPAAAPKPVAALSTAKAVSDTPPAPTPTPKPVAVVEPTRPTATPAVATTTTKSPGPTTAPPSSPAKPAKPARTVAARPEGAAPAGDADALLQEAQDAWLKGQYSAAIDASRKALKSKPGLTRAYQIIAVCSCSLRDAESATKAYERLDERNKQLVKTLCAKSGVTVE
jgi:pSer/pThr/pTyr-binding forkhead associated (FHA) protein/tetratricopeptide (TPR) repeat protein